MRATSNGSQLDHSAHERMMSRKPSASTKESKMMAAMRRDSGWGVRVSECIWASKRIAEQRSIILRCCILTFESGRHDGCIDPASAGVLAGWI